MQLPLKRTERTADGFVWSVGVCELVARGVNVLHARVLVRANV